MIIIITDDEEINLINKNKIIIIFTYCQLNIFNYFIMIILICVYSNVIIIIFIILT